MELDEDDRARWLRDEAGHVRQQQQHRSGFFRVDDEHVLSEEEMNLIAAALGADDPDLVEAARRLGLHDREAPAVPPLSVGLGSSNSSLSATSSSNGNSGLAILAAERGRAHILEQAAADGSSIVCERCHGLVATRRLEAHRTLWCPALP